ncbi:MAG: hypothetical protein GC150_04195 [Rhizobiales bacterium]|nr:hypothetical protein [Hyphomicrobiales bacterium]
MHDRMGGAFAPGQVWRYETRAHERESRIEILKVEDEGGTAIVHIRLVDVGILNPGLSGGRAPIVEHLPITEAALRASVTERLMLPASEPGAMEAYHSWREAFERGEAGVFDLTVAEIVELLDEGVAAFLAGEDVGGL